jgi:imidazoleglycerol-phosphate dehydratase
MLDQLARHSLVDVHVRCSGDLHIDDHHTVEDIGICLGQALADALGDKSGIKRYGCCYMPMDETLVRVVIDLSNRVFLHYDAPVVDEKVGTFDTQLAKEFMRALAQHSGITLHIDLLHGENCHHIIEAIFKGLGRALREAASLQEGENRILSSKGIL